MKISTIALAVALCAAASPALATEAAADSAATNGDILVIAAQQNSSIENAPSTTASVDASVIADRVNAVSVEDTIKYLPSLIVRKRHIGDNFAPIATRTSGLGSSARSLIYADGTLLSALIGNNNGNASPRWGLVSPEEVARIDILYGPFSAAYSGNSIGTVVNITTRMPDHLEGSITALTNIQQFRLYGTDRTLPTRQISANLGDRFGPLSLFASATRTISNGQPISFVTATRPATASASGTVTQGGFDDLSKLGAPIRVLGAGGLEHHVQDIFKLKAALDLTSAIRLTYVGGMFTDDTSGTAESYLSSATTGQPVYSGALNLGGYAYNVAANAFASSVYSRDARHLAQSLSLTGSGPAVDWQVIGSVYDYRHDIQRSPTGAMPAGFTGGAGQSVRLDGTGWRTLDGKLAWRAMGDDRTILSVGAHWDRYRINSNRYAMTDWTSEVEGALNQSSRGVTQTSAVWWQDAMQILPTVTVTIGGRYEWWHAFDGVNFSATPALNVSQPERRAHGFSPKASVEWRPAESWSARLSFGKAYRFPTVGELYQAITTGTTLSVPNPDLRPERALSEELALEHRSENGSIRLSIFNESITDALISQSAPLVAGSTTLYNYVQNVDRTRVRGVEWAVDQRGILPGIDVAASLTYANSATRADAAFPAAIGKHLPSVPLWKGTALVTWHADERVSLTGAARFTSRNYANLDNSDTVGNTYQGFYKYVLFDARVNWRVSDSFSFALGVDNITNRRYFLFHPFPQRSFTAEAHFRF